MTARRRIHLAGVFDSRSLRLYVDGQLQQDTRTIDRPHHASKFPIYIGADPGSSARPEHGFHGTIESVHIAAEALTPENFVLLGDRKPLPSTALLYLFEEGQGLGIVDLSDKTQPARMFGAEWVEAP